MVGVSLSVGVVEGTGFVSLAWERRLEPMRRCLVGLWGLLYKSTEYSPERGCSTTGWLLGMGL